MIAPLDRFHHVCQQLHARGGFAGSSLETTPLDGYARGEIFLGSRVDHDPETVDAIHVLSTRKGAQGQEEFATEVFLDRTERGTLDRMRGKPGTRHLDHYVAHFVRGASGAQLVDVALSSIDPLSGRVLESHRGDEAIREVWKLEERTGQRIVW